MKQKKQRNDLSGYMFILPSAIILVIFILAAILMTFYFSLTQYNGLQAPVFTGIKNYLTLLKDKNTWLALKNTVRFVVASVPLQTIISLAVAALLAANYRNRFGEFVRGALFVPVLCSATLVGSIFVYLFSSDAGGVANTVLAWFGIDKVNWLGDSQIAPWVLIGISVWKNIGYFTVIFYAGIMDIPLNLYEAAQIDGASKWQQFLRITIPNLKSIIFMVISVGTIWSFQFFDLSYVMTGGGPAYSNISLVYQIYNKGFKDFQFGYSSAISVLLFLFVVAVNVLQRVFMKEED